MKAYSAEARERRLHFENNTGPQDDGPPALSFVNTLKNRGSANPKEYLKNYEDFVYWCYHANIIDYDYYQVLSLEAYCYAREAKGVFEQVINARFMLYEIFLSIAKKEPADEIFMRQFNSEIDAASKHLRYESTPNGFRRVLYNVGEEISAPLWIIVLSAAELLVKADPTKIKQCKACGSLFFDRSKNKVRRWCSPSVCGDLLRAKRHYQAKNGIKAGAENVPV